MATITLNDQSYTLVCGDRTTSRAVYRGPKGYLRIGQPVYLEQEIAIHRRLLAQGFPVAPLLEMGEYAGQPFFIEAALGDVVFGDLFEAEMQAQGAVREASFRNLLTVVLRWAKAQLQNVVHAEMPPDLARTVRIGAVERLLPALVPLTHRVFALAQQRLAVFPTVLTHGDFHPHNICAGGVIDLEMVHWSVAGYDVITGLFGDDLLPPDPTDYTYTPQQNAQALADVDELFHTYRLPSPSSYIADFRMCRMMRIVELAEHRSPAIQQWVYDQYETQAMLYVASTDSNTLIP